MGIKRVLFPIDVYISKCNLSLTQFFFKFGINEAVTNIIPTIFMSHERRARIRYIVRQAVNYEKLLFLTSVIQSLAY